VARLRGSDVDGVGRVQSGDDGISVETVHRFKGLEAPVVLIALATTSSVHDLALAYTGLSRAQTMLEVFGPKSVLEGIHWDRG